MKKTMLLLSILFLAILTACGNADSNKEYDLSDLKECITEIISNEDSDACLETDQYNYIKTYLEAVLSDYGFTTATIQIDNITYIDNDDGPYLKYGLILDDIPVPEDTLIEDDTKAVLQLIDQTLANLSTIPVQSGILVKYNNDTSYRLNRSIEDELVYTHQVRSTHDIETMYDEQESSLQQISEEINFHNARFILSASDMIVEVTLDLVNKTYTTSIQRASDNTSETSEADVEGWVADTLGSGYQAN